MRAWAAGWSDGWPMPIEHSQATCPNCQRLVMVQRNAPIHWLHFILSCVTCVWGLVWLLITLSTPPFRCTVCGQKCTPPEHSPARLVVLLVVLVVLGGLLYVAIQTDAIDAATPSK